MKGNFTKLINLIIIIMLMMLLSNVFLPIKVTATNMGQEAHEFEVVDAHWEDQSGNIADVTGGDEAYLVITLRQSRPKNIEYRVGSSVVQLNKPPVAISGITVELEEADWLTPLGSRTATVNTAVPVGNTFTVRFHVSLKDFVKPGTYKGKLNITYTLAYDGDVWHVVDGRDEVEFTVDVPGKPVLHVSLEGRISAGNTSILNVLITNEGDAPVRNLEVSLSTEAPLDIQPDKVQVGELPPEGSATASFNVTAPYNYESPSTTFTVTLRYLSPSNVSKTTTWTTNLIETEAPRDYPIIDVIVNPSGKLVPGCTNTLELTLWNRGYSCAHDIQLQVYSQQASVTPSGKILIRELKPGSSSDVAIHVVPSYSLAGGTVILQYTLSYSDEKGKIYQETGSFSLDVESRSQLMPVFTLSPREDYKVYAGNKSIVFIKISNTGKGNAENVSVYVTSQSAAATACVNTIETIPPGNTVNVPVQLEVPATMRGNVIPLTIVLTYYDCLGELHSEQYTVTLKVSEELGYPELLIEPLQSLVIHTGGSTLPLIVVNEGTVDASDITLSFVPSLGLTILENSTYFIKQLRAGEAKILILKVYAEQQGSYSISCTAVYKDPWSNILKRQFSIGVRVLEKPQTRIIVFPYKNFIIGGQASSLSINLTVVNGDAKDIWIKASSQGASVIDSPLKHIQAIKEGETYTVNYTLFAPRSLIGSTAHLQLSIEYIDSEGVRKKDLFQFSLLVKGSVLMKLIDQSIHPERPRPGDEVGASLTIVNCGTDKARSVIGIIKVPPPLQLMSSSKIYIGDVDAGSIIPISFSIKIPENCQPGNATVRVRLEFTNSFNEKKTCEYKIPVRIYPPLIEEEQKAPLWEPIIVRITILCVSVALGVVLFAVKRRTKSSKG